MASHSDLKRTEKSKTGLSNADQTTVNFRAIVDAEKKARSEKDAKLRAARLIQEAQTSAEEAAALAAAPPKKTAAKKAAAKTAKTK